jgi:proline iminopeptidase
MQGPSEFTCSGVLEDWNITDRLKEISVPTVVLRGEYDTMTEECSMALVDNIPKCWPLITVPRAAHCKLLDEANACCEIIMKFVDTTENVQNA